METSEKYAHHASKYFLTRFKGARVIEEKNPENKYFWQIQFELGFFNVYISSEYAYLDFQVVTKSGKNLGILTKNKKIFGTHLETNIKNIYLIIDFLYKNRNEIFVEKQ